MEVVDAGFKMTEVGMIPEDWSIVRLEKDITVGRGGSPRPIQEFLTTASDGVNWIKIGDTDAGGKYIVSSSEKIIPEGALYSRKVDVGDFLLSNSMSFGRPYILKIDGCIHDGWLVLQNYQKKFDKEYLYYCLTSKYIFDQYLQKAAGSGVLNLNKELVKSVILIKPSSLQEQKAIATALSDVDTLISQLDQLIEKKQAIKQGAMQELLTGKTRLAGFGDGAGYKMTQVGRIPSDWLLYKVDDLIDLLTDYDANGSFASVAENVKVYDHEEYAWYVRSTDLENNSKMSEVRYVDKSSYNFLKKTALYGGELLFLKRGDIGKVYLFEMKTKRATVAPNLYLLKLNSISFSKYLYYFFLSKRGQSQLISKNASTTLGALYKDDVKSVYVPLPPTLTEQKAIATALSNMDSEIDELEVKRDKYKQIKQGMMQELLTGKTRLI